MPNPLRFDIVPHAGIGPVRLGATLAGADAALAKVPGAGARRSRSPTVHSYFDAALQIELGQSSTVQFIGISDHPKVLACYAGRDVFDLAAPDLFALIASNERRGRHRYRGAEYLFRDQVVTVYEADEQYDRKGKRSRPVFGQVGIGSAEYVESLP